MSKEDGKGILLVTDVYEHGVELFKARFPRARHVAIPAKASGKSKLESAKLANIVVILRGSFGHKVDYAIKKMAKSRVLRLNCLDDEAMDKIESMMEEK